MQINKKSEDIITIKNYHRVFAYGSNLNPTRLNSRLKNWDGSYQIASLPGYELRFNMFAEKQRIGANIVSHPTRRVRGIIIQLDDDDLVEIDKYEGYPMLYNRIEVQIEIGNNSMIEAYTYIAQQKWVTEGLLPSTEYVEHIISGALVYGLPEDYIKAIQKLARMSV